MKRLILLSIILLSLKVSYAQKDASAWKNEKNLEQQYNVFKENLNYWNKSYFMSGQRLDEFFTALKDSVAVLENETAEKSNTIAALQNELDLTENQLKNTQAELEASIKNRNSISIFGLKMDKSIFTLVIFIIIFGLLVILGVVFLLYKRSKAITVRTRKDYDELKEEFEAHKKNALERYTKINMELQHTRLAMNKK